MSNSMKYKGYDAVIEFSDEDNVFYGKVEGIRSLISFEGTDIESLRTAFKESINDYLETCKDQGIEPEVPYKGTFNIRVGKELHRKLALIAHQKQSSINQLVKQAIERQFRSH